MKHIGTPFLLTVTEGIPAIYGLRESEEAEVCLVLELLEGQTLHSPLPIETVLRYARQMPRLRKPRITTGIVQAFADKRLNSSAQPSTTTICLDVALSWSSSLIIRKRLPSAVTS